MALIPQGVIGTVGPILESHYTHAELNALFMGAGFPGDPPEGNKLQKCLSWLRRANAECSDPLQMFGGLIAELMDSEPSQWRLEQYQTSGDARERIQGSLKKDGLTYQRGGVIIGADMMGPSKSLAEILQQGGVAAIEVEYQRAYATIASDPGAAITAACAILEAVCKHYLQKESVPLPGKQTLGPLWTETSKHLGLSPGQMSDDDLKRILSGLFAIADGVAALRTHEGSAHGHIAKSYRIEPRHARLAVHAAHTMAVFVLETWDARGRLK